MKTIDLQFFLEPPELTVKGVLTIEALAPLSMVAAQPGKYYRSQPTPTNNMLYGLIENALGWHLHEDLRKKAIDALKKRLKKEFKKNTDWSNSNWIVAKPERSEVGYLSLLQYHLKFTDTIFQPAVITYDDLWSQQLRDMGRSFFGGSKHYDVSLSELINREKQQRIEFGDRAEFQDYPEGELDNLPDGSKIKYKSIRSRFPQYYVSPTVREYVIPSSSYLIGLDTTPTVSKLLSLAFKDPAGPLYLGSNDGWVEVNYDPI